TPPTQAAALPKVVGRCPDLPRPGRWGPQGSYSRAHAQGLMLRGSCSEPRARAGPMLKPGIVRAAVRWQTLGKRAGSTRSQALKRPATPPDRPREARPHYYFADRWPRHPCKIGLAGSGISTEGATSPARFVLACGQGAWRRAARALQRGPRRIGWRPTW